MNIAVISFTNHDVTNGIELLLEKYGEKNPNILLPVTAKNEDFVQSVLRTAIDKKAKVTCFFESAVGLDHLLKQADDISLTENPVKEVVRHLKAGDALGIVWDDSPMAHSIVHGVEELALDVWDIYDGLDSVETDDFNLSLDSDDIHDEMMATMGKFVDLMCAFVANLVMASLSEAVAEHIILSEDDDKKDIDPFNRME